VGVEQARRLLRVTAESEPDRKAQNAL